MERLRKYTAAVVQMDSRNDKWANLEAARRYAAEAAANGAKLVCFPENMNLCGRNVGKGGGRETIPGYTTEKLAKLARELRIFIHCGSLFEQLPGEERVANTSILLDPEGNILCRYRKLHTFDGVLADGTVCEESAKVIPGTEAVISETKLGVFGMSICYDVRFPELYRLMVARGAQVLFVPANFTALTGRDHWETLLRARAIENFCYVVAADQTGQKEQYLAHGNSMIVDPWGMVIAKAQDQPGIIYGVIDLDYVDKARSMIPALKNRRTDVYDVICRKG